MSRLIDSTDIIGLEWPPPTSCTPRKSSNSAASRRTISSLCCRRSALPGARPALGFRIFGGTGPAFCPHSGLGRICAACFGGQVVGYAYYVVEERKGLIGDLYVLREFSCPEYEDALLSAVLEALVMAPGCAASKLS